MLGLCIWLALEKGRSGLICWSEFCREGSEIFFILGLVWFERELQFIIKITWLPVERCYHIISTIIRYKKICLKVI